MPLLTTLRAIRIMAKKKRSKTPAKKKPTAREINRAVKELEKFYELGQRVLEKDDENPRKKVNSPGVIVKMVKAKKGRMSGDYIHKARNFAATYTPEQLEKLKELRRPDGMPLGCRHIIMLMRIKNKSQRNTYQRLAANKGWSINQIAVEVSKLFGKPGGAGGRKPQRAVDVDEVLMQIVKMTDHWGRWYDAYVPFEDATEDEQVVLDDLPNATREQLRLVTQQIDELKAKAERSLMKLREQ